MDSDKDHPLWKEKKKKNQSPSPHQKHHHDQNTNSKSQHKILSMIVDAPPLILPEKPILTINTCNCRKSRCLKMYCVCFSKGKMCHKSCFCDDCKNKSDNMVRSQAINEIITKDPFAFSKGDEREEIHGNIDDVCNCRKSNCLKKYCQCFKKGRKCGNKCQCIGCENLEKEQIIQGLKSKKKVKKQ